MVETTPHHRPHTDHSEEADLHISHLVIKNFRAIADLSTELSPQINVIVGPNGVGKTTILQAIRVAKAITAPRTNDETQQVLISLGAASPHFPQRVFLGALARDANLPIEVRCTYTLLPSELTTLRTGLGEIVQSLVASRLGQSFANPAILIQFLQTPQGQQALGGATAELTGLLQRLDLDPTLVLGVTLNGPGAPIVASDPLAGTVIGFLDQRLPPSTSVFSYFPADRALPMGEANLQLGGPDAQQQLLSHNSQPQIKYTRLKNLIINSLVIDQDSSDSLKAEFERIFSGLLKGRRLGRINVNELGLLSVMTEEISTGRMIELDSLSSGEKNVALTFLIVSRSVSEGGVALFDEPELHLNPAVSRDILNFIMSEYSERRNIQFIMCTHSPEILSGAFANDGCVLLHLKSATDITRVGRRALGEYSDALQKLGTSVTESLLYEGTLFVEGVDDAAFIEAGFPELSRKLQVKEMGGRREVEKAIAELQELESKGQKVAPMYLVFDRDDEITKFTSSKSVKIMQWKRRCVENYMIDVDVIANLLADDTITSSPIASEGEVHKLLQSLALEQLPAIAARETYNSYGYKNASLLKADVDSTEMTTIASRLRVRASTAKESLIDADSELWISNFIDKANKRRSELALAWESKWKEQCDGKKLISDLHKRANLRMSESSFKERITRSMRDGESENWSLVKSLLEKLIN